MCKMPESGLPPALENALIVILDTNKLTSWRISGKAKFVSVSIRFQVADMAGPGVFYEPRTFRAKPPSQVKKDTTRKSKWYTDKQKGHDYNVDEQDPLNCSNSTESSITELKHISMDIETRADCFGSQFEPCSQVLTSVTQITQSTDQVSQGKVTKLEQTCQSADQNKNIDQSAETTNSTTTVDPDHYPCDICATPISTDPGTVCWTCNKCVDFAICIKCKNQNRHQIHKRTAPFV